MAKTLYDKIWDAHLVHSAPDGTALIYIDRHMLHEVTSPQAFAGLRANKRHVWRVQANLAVADHNVPTIGLRHDIKDPLSRLQVEQLEKNCLENNIRYFSVSDIRQGIVHIVGPEQGATLPGMTIVCGDSHTATHGAFGALAHGIGTSEVEHVLATQTLLQKKSKSMRILIKNSLNHGVTAKDLILYIIGKIGTAGGTGYVIEFAGQAITDLSMEGRMTVCNMAIEAGARAGLIAVDEKTINYVRGRPFSPTGKDWEQACEYWQTLHSDEHAKFDFEVTLDAKSIEPQVSWGTSPEMVSAINDRVPCPENFCDLTKMESCRHALTYMGLEAGMAIKDIMLDKVFIGSCTNARIEDLRAAAKVVSSINTLLAPNIKLAMVVPGSGLVKQQAEQEGLDKIFLQAGFEWREPGCSMCLAMNEDKLAVGERCASTSNRNFEGRQGPGGRTHLVSPAMAAAAALMGHFMDVRQLSL